MQDEALGGPAAAPWPDAGVELVQKPVANHPSTQRVWAGALAMGALAGAAAWLVGEFLVDFHRATTHVVFGSGGPMVIASPAELASTLAKNATLAFGVLGALLGVALGGAGGLLRGSTRSATVAGILGLAVGLATGVASSMAVLPIYNRIMDRSDETTAGDLLVPLLTHGAIWSAVGAACGLAFGIGLGGRSRVLRSVLGGLVGGALGAAVYELIGAFAFPLDRTVQPLSISWESRLLAREAVAVFVAAGAAAAYAEPRRGEASEGTS
ncbi:MAG: hypothetical protein P4L85_05460 [Paludisphaera borealis]|uniref:hypothetical protein n=1 Tax=Paludisphaera borealis TaxID=1387353 RepID=UPI00283C9841|nr:hypothetical protein [Paludisphaera borealis]MDR3618778.1 hypothetical protein [Paludisphaera borealis]